MAEREGFYVQFRKRRYISVLTKTGLGYLEQSFVAKRGLFDSTLGFERMPSEGEGASL
jgi:hypothetical protein